MAKIYYANRTYYSIEEKVDVDDVVSEIKYNWYYNADKSLVVRETIADGSYKIWFNNLVIDTQYSGQYRYEVPANLNNFGVLRNTIRVKAEIISGTEIAGYAGFDYISGQSYVYLNKVGSASNRFSGTIVKALMYSTDTGNAQDHLSEWTDPTFDPING